MQQHASKFDARSALTALTRLARREPGARASLEHALHGRLEHLAGVALDVAVEAGEPIGSVLAEAIEREGSTALVRSMLTRFNESRYRDSIALFNLTLELSRKALDHHRALSVTEGEESLVALARLANNHAFALSRLGKQEEAREAAKSAVETFRRLPSTSPRRDFDLAVGLNNLGIIESNLGAQAEALRANEEAVLISRGLGDKWSVEARSVLARSLLNLGSVLFSFGAGEKALMATREAVEIFRRLTSESPEAFGPDLARSLNKLGEILRSLGRLEEALESISVALNVRRTLAAGRPDVFLAELASSLQNLASTLGQQRTRSEDALSAIQEAVAIRRRIAAQGPQATHLDLVDTLEQLSASLLEAGERERAIEAVLEAIHILEDANAEQPLELASRLRSLMDRLVAALEDPATTGGTAFRVTLLEQVVRSVARFFRKQPLLFADPMNTALLKYLTTLLRLEKEPDRELLRPIIQAVEKEIVKGSSTLLR